MVECVICGNQFVRTGGNTKYCSDDCKKAGQKKRRQEWEKRTGYKEKQRQAANERRIEAARIAEQEEKERNRKKKSAETKARRKKEREQLAKYKKAAEQGDKVAMMNLARREDDFHTYWRLYKELILEENEKFNRIGFHTVGGIDVYEDMFENKIIEILNKK